MSVMRTRIIPVLLLENSGLYKTRRFKDPSYVGDPINCVKIFNDKEVDELCFLDMRATLSGEPPNFELLAAIASECFMPLSYGGGVSSVEMVRKLTSIGFEKVVVNSAAYTDPMLIPQLVECFGTSTIVGSIDVKKNWLGNEGVYIKSGTERIPGSAINWAKTLEASGVGEIIINDIDSDGEMNGYNFDLIRRIASSVSVPVIAAGGAKSLEDFHEAVKNCGASAVAAGAMFIYYGKHRAVLVTYPNDGERGEL
ncbi:AglZ/HisF2 family acetamidino modification protein [Pseudomonadales bacterium]|nr:AglZ/HisF2 family acetamidino modification protein [Pseudomonadales bacterium]